MLSLDELCSRVQRSTGVDARSLYELYCEQDKEPTEEGFAYFLCQEKVIDNQLLAELVLGTGVDTVAWQEPELVIEKEAQLRKDNPSGSSPPRYELLGCLGRGAMGEVFVARDVALRRKVAFKTLLPQMAGNKDVVRRFVGEVQITSQLDHPAIVPVYGLESTSDGRTAYAMKWVQGRELKTLLEEAKRRLEAGESLPAELQRRQRIEHLLRICDAVSFAHDKGIIHRDLKPANIMVGGFGEVYLMDWGIAKAMHGGADLEDSSLDLAVVESTGDGRSKTRVGRVIGTPIYMSPEQARGNNAELDDKSDLYALGLVLQRILTLERSIPGDNMTQVLEAARAGERVTLRSFKGEPPLERELKAIVEKATEPEKAKRYDDVAALAADLRCYLRGEAVVAAPDNALQKLGRWSVRHRMLMLAVVVVLFAVGTAATVSVGSMVHEREVVGNAHRRERGLSRFLSESASAAAEIDLIFQRIESMTERLMGASNQALQNPADDSAVPHRPRWFRAEPGRTVQATGYRNKINVQEPVLVEANPNDDEKTAETKKRLASLRQVLRHALLDTADDRYESLSVSAQNRLILRGEGLVVGAFVTTESGLLLAYPASAEWREPTDGRRLSSYAVAKGRTGPVWGLPHMSKAVQSRVVACSGALHGSQGKVMGVAGVQVSVDRLFKRFFRKHSDQGVFLITGSAELVLGDKEAFKAVKGESLLARIRNERYGIFPLVEGNKGSEHGPKAAVYPIQSASWYYIRQWSQPQQR